MTRLVRTLLGCFIAASVLTGPVLAPTQAHGQALAPGQPGGGGVLAPSPTPRESPLSLTASDGAGLRLVSLEAQAVIDDPLAFTELRLVFENPEDRVREGRFRITLPEGAALSRFAMRVGEHWQEGEVVERQAARRAYEDFLHRRQDPALLEAEAGNEFQARVFPIPARGRKELIVSYSQELASSSAPYRLPLAGLPKVGHLTVRALLGVASASRAGASSSLGGRRSSVEAIEVERKDFRPDRDFEVDVPARRNGRLGLRHEELVVARVQPLGGVEAPEAIRSLVVLFDTSASRAPGFAGQVAALGALVSELERQGDPDLLVAAFDQDVERIYAGPASGFGDTARAKLLGREALGASDLAGALAWVERSSPSDRARDRRERRVLLITDGVATAGAVEGARLAAAARGLAAFGVSRIDALAIGGIRDTAALQRITTALPAAGLVLDGGLGAERIAARLGRATRSGIAVEVEGARWSWPSRLDGVQAGDEILVYADLPDGRPLRVKVGGKPLALSGTLVATARPLLERAWVKARIDRLFAERDRVASTDPDLAAALRQQVLSLSVQHRVLTPWTALLVLETEADYVRFGIDRRALADILTVGPAGLVALHRSEAIVATPPGPAPHDAVETATIAESVSGRAALRQRASAPRVEAKQEEARSNRGGVAGGVAPSEEREDRGRGSEARKSAAARSAVVKEALDEEFVDDLPQDRGRASGGRPPEAPVPAPSVAAEPPSPTAESVTLRERDDAAPSLGARPRRFFGGSSGGGASDPAPVAAAPGSARRTVAPVPQPPRVLPLEGPLAEFMALLERGQRAAALEQAQAWRRRDRGDVLALVALGEAGEALGRLGTAARAYGSIIDLFPGRADLRRYAGNRLERVATAAARALAIDTFRKAVADRPDHPSGARMLAMALVKAGRHAEAFDVLVAALRRSYPGGRFAGVVRILRDDLGLVAAAWSAVTPTRADEISERARAAGATFEGAPSLRFVLTWETDANDVDFHIHDGKGGHAFYSKPRLPSGGELYADVTTGYGPECFTIRGQARALPYRLRAHYYRRGPMGYGMGKLQVIEHDGRGGLRFEERPFIVMSDGAFLELGTAAGGKRVAVAR